MFFLHTLHQHDHVSEMITRSFCGQVIFAGRRDYKNVLNRDVWKLHTRFETKMTHSCGSELTLYFMEAISSLTFLRIVKHAF